MVGPVGGAPAVSIDQEYEIVPIDGDVDILKEHPQNHNRGNVGMIEESVEINGWYGAVIAQKSTGYILAGNHRYRVWRDRGEKEIPVIWKDVDDETALKILLVDNASTRAGEIDEEQLDAILQGLTSLDGTGYGLSRLEDSLEAETGAEEASGSTNGDRSADEMDGPDGLGGDEDAEGTDIPDDKYTPQYGVMIVLDDEEGQESLYGWIQDRIMDGVFKGEGIEDLEIPVKLRVIAV